jgi:hypothetical protein
VEDRLAKPWVTFGTNCAMVQEDNQAGPVIVPPDKYDVWLDLDVNDFNVIRDILRPYDANLMRRYPVSRKLNNSRIDDAESASPRHARHAASGAVVLISRLAQPPSAQMIEEQFCLGILLSRGVGIGGKVR